MKAPKTIVLKRYKNGGTIEIYADLEHRGSDHKRVYACCRHFARRGKQTIIMPNIHYKDPLYKIIFKTLIGTRYERKCPDFSVNGVFYEHESFTSLNGKRTFKNMLKRGTRQSERIIIEDCGITDRFAERWCREAIKRGDCIDELFVIDKKGNIRKVFNVTEGK